MPLHFANYSLFLDARQLFCCNNWVTETSDDEAQDPVDERYTQAWRCS